MPDTRPFALILFGILCLTSCQTKISTSELNIPLTPPGATLAPFKGTYRNIPANKTGRDHTESDLWLLAGGKVSDLKAGSDTVTIEPFSSSALKFTLHHHGAPVQSFTRRLARRGDWLDLGCRPTAETNIVLSKTGKECALMGITSGGKLCIAKKWQGWGWWLWMPIARNEGQTMAAYYHRID